MPKTNSARETDFSFLIILCICFYPYIFHFSQYFYCNINSLNLLCEVLNDSVLNTALTQSLSLGNNEINNITSDQSTITSLDLIQSKFHRNLTEINIYNILSNILFKSTSIYLLIPLSQNEIANNAKSFYKA